MPTSARSSIPWHAADEFAALRDTTVTVLAGIGHTPPWEAPAVVAHAVIRSLSRQKS